MKKTESFSQIFESLKKISDYNAFIENGGVVNDSSDMQESLTHKYFIRPQDIAYLRALSNIRYYRTLNSSNKILSKPVVFIKRIIRKLGKFLIEPPLQDISIFNDATVNFLERLIFFSDKIEVICKDMQKKVQTIEQLETICKGLQTRVQHLESENKTLTEKYKQLLDMQKKVQTIEQLETICKGLQTGVQHLENENKTITEKYKQLLEETNSLKYYKDTVIYLNDNDTKGDNR